MKWEHKCDLGWLKARQNYLTATDIKDLLPFTKSGRARNVTKDHYLSVLARKHKQITEEECISTGAAARGHILEPYAVKRFNQVASYQHPFYHSLHHWDDGIIPKEEKIGSLAFSPDACDVQQEYFPSKEGIYSGVFPDAIGEIKSYSAEKHMVLGYTDPEVLEERWQIATAMACVDSIHTAYLILYNPSMKEQMFIKKYERADLAKEIGIVELVSDNWLTFLNDYGEMKEKQELENVLYIGCSDRESLIIEEIEKEHYGSLNRP